jgi:hypothetical protein
MNRTSSVVALVVLSFTLTACQKQSAPKEPAPTPASDTKHAIDSVKPGSYEDWCDEHQVPETMCTRCNPKLVAAFKATNDWCEEHQLPESQCKLCNPSLKIERPPKPTGAQ